ncbi:MAG: class I SAM-dependent methyltransferase [Alphaproteobacteria bacterium]|nr:class I SAM-dependent methyltransferase [Alphaproteobacteria bacterium]
MAVDKNIHETRVRKHFLPLLDQHGVSSLAVGYRHSGNHIARYRILAGIGDFSQASLLDVGCGIGHFAGWLNANGHRGAYTGVDLMPEMVDKATALYPGRTFAAADILSDDFPHSADYVIASGIFHMGDAKLMKKMIAAMFEVCNIGVAFNSLSSWYDTTEQGEFYCADPLEILEYCRTLTPNILFRHDYLPHDFTVFIYKDDQIR